jgi:hypothetical protein
MAMFFVSRTTPPFDAGDRDDAARALLHHRREYALGGEERAAKVDALDAIPLLARKAMDRATPGDPGRGHEDIDPAERLDGVLHESDLGFFVANIARVKTRGFGLGLDLPPLVGWLEIEADHRCFLGGEAMRACQADP